ncbi:MAG: hypothetical protein JWN65_2754 [Solirubrobacterales bacterium]|jgi:hypothetical protein|nr:hypothetical protein [Solirubrobacterales bacterium]
MSPAETRQHNSTAVRSFDGFLIGFIVAAMGLIALGAAGIL